MPRRRNFYDDEASSMGLESLVTGRGARRGWGMGARSPGRGTRFWRPSEALQSQPFFGFPGGQTAWERFRGTGEMPMDPGTGRPIDLTPEAQDFYYRVPVQEGRSDPGLMGTVILPSENSYAESPNPYQPGGEAFIYAQQGAPPQLYGSLESLVAPPTRGWRLAGGGGLMPR